MDIDRHEERDRERARDRDGEKCAMIYDRGLSTLDIAADRVIGKKKNSYALTPNGLLSGPSIQSSMCGRESSSSSEIEGYQQGKGGP